MKCLVSTMILASLGSRAVGYAQTRHIRVVNDTHAPIITDAFVGVCCKSMQKLCIDAKQSMLCDERGVKPVTRDTKYDGVVQPQYQRYPSNPLACA